MIFKKIQKIIIGIVMLVLLVLISILIWGHEEVDTSQCPEWINCMPGPGRGECGIPEGCENVTKIAW